MVVPISSRSRIPHGPVLMPSANLISSGISKGRMDSVRQTSQRGTTAHVERKSAIRKHGKTKRLLPQKSAIRMLLE